MLLFLYWLEAIDSLWSGLDYTLPLGKVKAWKMEVVITLEKKQHDRVWLQLYLI